MRPRAAVAALHGSQNLGPVVAIVEKDFGDALEPILLAERERVVPISELFYGDGGGGSEGDNEGVVAAASAPPTSASERFRLELVSQGQLDVTEHRGGNGRPQGAHRVRARGASLNITQRTDRAFTPPEALVDELAGLLDAGLVDRIDRLELESAHLSSASLNRLVVVVPRLVFRTLFQPSLDVRL